ncbi:MAG TPA: N-acetylmuramoyl-L-alanine amidase [Solirubrobacteraceae bacterium]|nr:N-acetylmuramoyl-L-alanine amidase [Solirubrobacteraceae bacterium]
MSASRRRLAWLLTAALLAGAVAWAALDGSGHSTVRASAPARAVAAVSDRAAPHSPGSVASASPRATATASTAPAAGGGALAPVEETGAPPTPVTTPTLPLAGRTITVDPGHNGGNFSHPREIGRLVPDGNGVKVCDTTGTAAPDGYREADFNWSVGRRLRALLIAAGAKVVMTRASNDGVGPCVNERAAIGNRARSDAAISIHGDGGPPGGSGFAVLLPAPIPGGGDGTILAPSRRLGVDLRGTLLHAGLHTSTYDGRNGLAPRTDLGGLNLSRVPKVFVEVANMQNAADEAPMERPAWRELIARALLAGIERFLPAR